MLNLPDGFGTATIESKTNLFAAGRVRAECTALHEGLRTMVWQKRVTNASGRLLSLTVQTQMVLEKLVRRGRKPRRGRRRGRLRDLDRVDGREAARASRRSWSTYRTRCFGFDSLGSIGTSER